VRAYLEVLGGRQDRWERIHLNEHQLEMEGDDIMEWTSKELTALVKLVVGDDWPVIDRKVIEEAERPLPNPSDEELDSEDMGMSRIVFKNSSKITDFLVKFMKNAQ